MKKFLFLNAKRIIGMEKIISKLILEKVQIKQTDNKISAKDFNIEFIFIFRHINIEIKIICEKPIVFESKLEGL
tara:strand:+ start:826 stop:1047 length:222 start_codon:yes stop_codon:yes gene_type:complete